MQIVIDIPQKVYDKALSGDGTGAIWAGYVKNSTPLPEHHGRLIDAKDVGEHLTLADVPTIIEAESE